jgi:CubicO group peptidase (beta-lactamase class C family)
MWSYNNSGFYLVGRAIEVVTGKSFEAAMKDYIFDPLGLDGAYYFAEDVISRRFVVGHVSENDVPLVARPWALARTANPAGGIITSVPDLFRYARFHLDGGVAADGTRLLSTESIADMQTPRFRSTDPQSVCLTWYMTDLNGTQMFGHGGGTNGQTTQFQMIPAHNMALVILTNSHRGPTLINTVTSKILQEYLGVEPTSKTHLALNADELAPYLGRYEAPLDDVELVVQDGELMLLTTSKGGFPVPSSPPLTQPPPVRAAFYGDDKIVVLDDPFKDTNCQFLRNAAGEIEWLRIFGRVHRRM